MPSVNRFSAALKSAQANLVRVREQEGRLLTELHDEIQQLNGMTSCYGTPTIPFSVHLDVDDPDFQAMLSITIEPDKSPCYAQLNVVIGQHQTDCYAIATQEIGEDELDHEPLDLPGAIDFIAAWAAERMPQ